jgi:hypothetical protein
MWAFLTIVPSVFIIAVAVQECLNDYWEYRKHKDGLK